MQLGNVHSLYMVYAAFFLFDGDSYTQCGTSHTTLTEKKSGNQQENQKYELMCDTILVLIL